MPQDTISIAEFKTLLESGRKPTILDVRTPAEFVRLHAAGAKLTPLDSLDPAALPPPGEILREAIFVICQSGARAGKAQQKLAAAGVMPVFSIEGGTAAWEKAGLPIDRGQGGAISLERQVRIAAGSLVLAGLILAWAVHPLFLAVSGFIGAGLVFSGITDYCGMALLLAKMPWNKPRSQTTCATTARSA